MKIEKNCKKINRTSLNNNGITLVGLVITIIVLIILAGVGINLILGDNGIIKKAKEAKVETEIEQIKEKVQIDIAGVLVGNKTTEISRNQLKTVLDEYFDNVPEDYTLDTEITAKKEYGSHKIKISDIYIGIITERITAQDIVNETDKRKYYGATVNGYECPNSAGVKAWKIFYADEKNIYLIADDYIHYDYCPASATQTIYKNSDYKLSMNNVIKDYSEGSENIVDPRMRNLNKSYFKYLTENKKTSKTNSIKAVAYMTDINVWKVFAGEKAEYAIGGPTIEMIMQSYSEKYNLKYKARAKNVLGYEISINGGTSWTNEYQRLLNTEDSLYVIKDTKKATSMWVASPSGYIDGLLINIASGGSVYFYYYNANYSGFRPLVCLKSDVQLQKNTDGTYTIK